MKLLAIWICIYPFTLVAQISFELLLPQAPLPTVEANFDGIEYGSVSVADANGNTFKDVLMTGFNGTAASTTLYFNDGIGNYPIALSTPFEGIKNGDACLFDVNGDNVSEVLIAGLNNSNLRITKLYSNDGAGNFTEVVGTIFDALDNSATAYADVDNDLDLDLVIAGDNGTTRVTKLYLNDGNGNFSLSGSNSFDGVEYGDLSFGDIDNDNDQDLLVTGLNNSNARIAKVYQNNGAGIYTLVAATPFNGVYYSGTEFGDFDNDNDQDLLLSGRDVSGSFTTELYENNGFGIFSLVSGTPFDGIKNSDVIFGDIDGDNDLDVLIAGYNNSNDDVTLLYENVGGTTFIPVLSNDFYQSSTGGLVFYDVDNDTDLDIVIAGRITSTQRVARLYQNDGFGNFSEVTQVIFDGVSNGQAIFTDINNDNNPDAVLVGEPHPSGYQSSAHIYANNGSNVFTQLSSTGLIGSKWGSVASADVDNDLDQDLVITGQTIINVPTTKLYFNDGFGNYSEDLSTSFDSVYWSSIAFSDIDNDSDQDLLITGRDPSFNRIAKLYTNDGLGNFSEVLGTILTGVYFSAVEFVDIDNDLDNDLMITGQSASGPSTKLYTNDGTGVFTEVVGTGITNVQTGDIDFADVNGDNFADFIITGVNPSNVRIAELYLNDGTGNFTISPSTLNGVYRSSIDFADIEGDGDQDVLISGKDAIGTFTAQLYINDGLGGFTAIAGMPFIGTEEGTVVFEDVDSDNDPDVLITGNIFPYPLSLLPIARLYINNSCLIATSVDTQTVCNSLLWLDGTTYTSSTNSPQHVISGGAVNGCDSIITLNLTVNNSFSTDQFTSCDSLVWMDGITYTASNNSAVHVLTNNLGCDSIINLDLTINYSNSGTDIINSCDSLVWIDGITYFANNNSAQHVLTNTMGCDSTVNLNLIVSTANSGTDIITACDSITWIDGVTYTANNFTATHHLLNQNGCDSLVTLNLTINSIDTSVILSGATITANTNGAIYQWLNCDNSNSVINGETNQSILVTANGNYAVQISENGCIDTSSCINISFIGLNDDNALEQVIISPNPTNGIVRIFLGELKETNIHVYSPDGKLIYVFENTKDQLIAFNLEGSDGIYFIEITNSSFKKYFKIIKF